MFLAFIAPSRVPATDVKILATALAFGILSDATIVRGVLAPALVAALGPANWWQPFGQTAAARSPAVVNDPESGQAQSQHPSDQTDSLEMVLPVSRDTSQR